MLRLAHAPRPLAHTPRPAAAALAAAALAAGVLAPHLTGANAADPFAPSAAWATASGATATVSWQEPALAVTSVDHYTITATDAASGYFGTEYAAGAAHSVSWPGLVLGHTYSFAVTATTTRGQASPARKAPAIVVGGGLCAAATSVCAAVDGAHPTSLTGKLALGVLDTALTAGTNRSAYTLLGLTGWRFDENESSRAQIVSRMAPGTTSTAILFDAWNTAQGAHPTNQCAARNGKVGANPWDDWATYDSWVASFVRGEITAHRAPTYWDVINEPSVASFHVDAKCTQAPTTALVEQVLQHTYDDIKRVSPGAKVMAPSLGYVNAGNLLETTTDGSLLPFAGMLTFSDQHDLRWDAIDYHELGANNGTSTEDSYLGLPQAVSTHLVSVRQLMSMHPSARGAKLFVNEFDGSGHFAGSASNAAEFNTVPGRAVGYLAALTSGGASGAGLSCWNDRTSSGPSDCFNGSLDGLLDPSNGQRRSTWFAYQRASCMVGSVAPFSSSAQSLTGYAATTGSWVRVMLGRFDYRKAGAAVPVTLNVAAPSSLKGVASVTIQRIPNSLSSAVRMPASTTVNAPVSNGVVHVVVGSFADNDAYTVIVRPAGAALTACDVQK